MHHEPVFSHHCSVVCQFCTSLQTVQFHPQHRAFLSSLFSLSVSQLLMPPSQLDHRLIQHPNQPRTFKDLSLLRKNSLICLFLSKASVLSDQFSLLLSCTQKNQHGGFKHHCLLLIYYNRDMRLLPHDLPLVFVSE